MIKGLWLNIDKNAFLGERCQSVKVRVTAESHRRSNIEEFGKVPRQNDMGLLISHNIYATNKAVSTVPSQRAMVSLV